MLEIDDVMNMAPSDEMPRILEPVETLTPWETPGHTYSSSSLVPAGAMTSGLILGS